ncbi:hypothetical protein L1987_74448 [Smallanthus sonchifolius]|uniref:Uncharacterized protein n=1 Tax=Smallanthus sonchifolius TaxID=185202 RepID=A0ACB9A324_9ASTR|nr:hypothetical protein L1987_74448 [Smallanthus sonchifolius]
MLVAEQVDPVVFEVGAESGISAEAGRCGCRSCCRGRLGVLKWIVIEMGENGKKMLRESERYYEKGFLCEKSVNDLSPSHLTPKQINRRRRGNKFFMGTDEMDSVHGVEGMNLISELDSKKRVLCSASVMDDNERTLFSDDMPMVRSVAATNLGKFAATMEPAHLKTHMQIFEDLTQDDEVVEDEVIDNEEVADKKTADELVEKSLVEDDVIHNEEVSNKENEKVIREEIGVEKIIDDVVNCGNDEQDMQTTGAKLDEKNQEGDNEEKHEEDTQEWGLDKLKEEMNKVEIELAMYENRSLEETKKGKKDDNKRLKKKKKGSSPRSLEVRRRWRHKLFDANVGYTWPSLNRMGDERLLKELDNLKKLVGGIPKSVLKDIQEAMEPENVDKDVDTLLASVIPTNMRTNEKGRHKSKG